ncbi:hypothetical protein [Stratiformator vulcanicus]|uniref:Uncharacterized protein n=1 Tax=Stratiformator vulcanicus TaxID=2527980 RepID=A0A517QXU1_9PLAN|nr:hypothetical protein [Stratiformator vulcanicus]QDT36424.1 hypothetical protein Pan189_07800 [Stratiformator vulcanicus]
MTIELPSDVEEQINRAIASGAFTDPIQVIRTALRSMDIDDETRAVMEDVEASLADEAAGRTRSLDEVTADIESQRGWSAS